MFWRDIEPEPGVYSDDKLAEIRQTLDWAEQLNMLVLLDMHQDLYCSPEAGGMPAWTLIEADLPHITGGPNWRGAYFLSPRVQAAFDHFWLNTPGPDGIGIQDRFAATWRHVTSRVGGAPALLGYDLLNEPFPGSPTNDALTEGTAAILSQTNEAPPDSDPFSLGMWAFTLACQDDDLFAVWLAATAPQIARLDADRLRPCYQRVTEAIRQVDSSTAIFIEPFITANSGVIPETLRWNGPTADDPNLVFAPHIYVADPLRAASITRKLLDLAKRERMPLVVGEWGNLDNADNMHACDATAGARAMLEIVNRNAAGRFYWVYGDGLPNEPFFSEFVKGAVKPW